MKVTKNYLRRLIEQELRNIHEDDDDPLSAEPGGLGGLGGEKPSLPPDAGGVAEPETAEAMLEKVHADLERWLGGHGGDVSPSTDVEDEDEF